MKNVKKFIPLILLASFLLLTSFFQVDPEPIKLKWYIVLPIILGLYDVIVRLIPMVNDISWLSWIIKLIAFLNEFFNRKKKK